MCLDTVNRVVVLRLRIIFMGGRLMVLLWEIVLVVVVLHMGPCGVRLRSCVFEGGRSLCVPFLFFFLVTVIESGSMHVSVRICLMTAHSQ
jgi:hypothetical protein